MAVIDYHKKYFGANCTGRQWKLTSSETKKFSDQFEPYKGIFGCSEETFTDGKYPATMFRFPLRQEASELSETIYSSEKMMALFESFQTDARMTLLFLKQLESIELYVRNEEDETPEKVFQVRIVNADLVRSKRDEFLSRISPDTDILEPVAVTYPVTIETAKFSKGSAFDSRQHSFLLTDYYAGGQISSQLDELTREKSLSYLPWVGVALPLPSEPRNDITHDDVSSSKPIGHLFCFLPLPFEKKSLTGLPVHVNGFFALSQNRRHLKWPSADQDDSKPLTDKALLWNKCLLEDVVPKAYAELVRQATNQSVETSEPPSERIVYKAWPDVSEVDTKWKGMVERFFCEFLNGNVVYTAANNGKWVKIHEAIFDRPSETVDAQEIVRSVLLQANFNIVTVPQHVKKGISNYYRGVSSEVTPEIVRNTLKSINPAYTEFKRNEKLLLLGYVLKDDSFQNLYDLQLLPISDGSFIHFSCYANNQDVIYITSEGHPQSLLPGLERIFLDQTIDTEIVCQLKKVAEQGKNVEHYFATESVLPLDSGFVTMWRG